MNSIKKLAPYLPLAIMAVPFVAGAQTIETILEGTIRPIINILIPIVIGVGLLVFFWGLISYLTAGGDDEKKKEARGTMIYGVIIFFVMIAIWGLVRILIDTFGIQSVTPISPDMPV